MKALIKGESNMSYSKIGARRQVTIPVKLFKKLHLQAGELVEFTEQKGKIILIPKQLTNKPAVPHLNKEEQKTLIKAQKKIFKINTDPINSIGLNNKEIEVAVKTGLIEQDQSYWWHEDWQKGEREADRDIAAGRISKVYDDVDELINDLNS